jgi:hypothetical protein
VEIQFTTTGSLVLALGLVLPVSLVFVLVRWARDSGGFVTIQLRKNFVVTADFRDSDLSRREVPRRQPDDATERSGPPNDASHAE